MRLVLTASLLLGGALACSTRGPVDGTPPPNGHHVRDTLPKVASLARRLAEAADGYRDGKPKWVVAHIKGNNKRHHRVVGVFSTAEEADIVARREGDEYAAFGPFLTPEEDYRIPRGERVDSVIVIYADGQRKYYDGDSVDALFWGLPAFDKFIGPYLSSVSSPDYAAEQRKLYRLNDRRGMGGTEAVAHKRGSF
ncbi:MAG TPA: hypothetical protein VJ808_10350 [Gemmatimonadales bacterium]|nr:hypothetical protein [Gemmatimonadales bacterium]